MYPTVANLTDDVAALLTGTNLNNVKNLFRAYQRAAAILISRASIPEALGRQPYTVYNNVFNYLAPSGIFGGSLTDFQPQGVTRTPLDWVYHQGIEQFDMTKCYLPNGVSLTFEMHNGTGIVRINSTRTTASIQIDGMNSTNGYTQGGTVSGLTTDTTVYYQQPASLRFTLTGAGSGYLQKTLQSPLNMPTYNGVGVIFLAIDTPSAADLASINLQIGSDSSNYNSLTVTEGFIGAWQADDFTTLVAFDMALAATVGTPNWSAIQYFRVTCTTLGTLTNMRVGQLFASLPFQYEMLYQSNAIFQNATTGALLQNISANSNKIILNPEAYVIYQHECAITVYLQNGGSLSGGLVANFNSILNGARAKNGSVIQMGLYDLYRANNPSEKINTIGNWYE